MADELSNALIAFINERSDGNALRDIAIRTLKDHINKYQYYVEPEQNENRLARTLNERKTVRPLPLKERELVTGSEVNVYVKKNLKKIIERSHMKKTDFANKFGFTTCQLKHYQHGSVTVPINLIINVCTAFDIPLEKFTTEII